MDTLNIDFLKSSSLTKAAAIKSGKSDRELIVDFHTKNIEQVENDIKDKFEERVVYLIQKLNIGRRKELSKDECKEFELSAYVIYVKIRKWLRELELDKMLLRENQRMLALKYHELKKRIDFVQISVIAVASCITFIDSVQQYMYLPTFLTSVLPIVLSTYIGFIIAVARLYKWDDMKETLTQMNEKLALVINQLWQKIKFGHLHCNIEPSIEWREYFKTIHAKLDDYDKDGLVDQVVQLKQEIDVIMNYSEKLKYKDRLATLNLSDAYITKKIKTVDRFRNQILLENKRVPDYPKYKFFVDPIKRLTSMFSQNNVSKSRFFKEEMYCKDEKSEEDMYEV